MELIWPAPAEFAWLMFAALAGGLARGFSGFGAALIFVPLAAVVLGPRAAAPLMLLLDIFAIVGMTRGAWRVADRPECGWLLLGSAIGTPAGAWVLAHADPVALRWAVAGLILVLLGVMLSGWRFAGAPRRPVTVAVGAAGGVLGGIAMVSGPPVMAYLFGRGMPPGTLRAVFTLYLSAGGILAGIAYAVAGLLLPALLAPWLIAAPAYAFGIWAGARLFGLASALTFRRACYAMIALAALLSLPAWDGLLR